jgi:hypothetical protein
MALSNAERQKRYREKRKRLVARAYDRIRYRDDPRVPELLEHARKLSREWAVAEAGRLQLKETNGQLLRELAKVKDENDKLKRQIASAS